MGGRCVINRDCKVGAIKKYLRTIGEEYTQYIGIAIDEPKRLARLKDNQISLLAKYGYTEQMAMELCRKYNLVSPIYEIGTRGGCWFCPNAKISALANFRNKHPELWQELEILSQTENLCTTGFKWGLTLQEVNEKIDKFNKKQKEVMNIREMQLSLFDSDPDTIVGGVSCSLGHRHCKPKQDISFRFCPTNCYTPTTIRRQRRNGNSGRTTKNAVTVCFAYIHI